MKNRRKHSGKLKISTIDQPHSKGVTATRIYEPPTPLSLRSRYARLSQKCRLFFTSLEGTVTIIKVTQIISGIFCLLALYIYVAEYFKQ